MTAGPLRRYLLALAATALAACTTKEVGIPDLTGTGSVVGTLPVSVPVAPPVTKPSPTPAPAPNATPTPDPMPTPTPTPRASSCQLPPGGGDPDDCERTSPTFLTQLESALDQLAVEQPQLFDKTDTKCPNCYKVLDPADYVRGVQDQMKARGLCVLHDGEELAVKNSNEFNDQFDILTADLYIRRGEGSYRATCRPPWF